MRLISWPKVICFGDSLTQFGWSADGAWVASLADQLQRRCDVINRGFSGYTSRTCRAMMPHLFGDSSSTSGDDSSEDIVMVVIWLGANDSNNKDGVQHVPVTEFRENMSAIVDGFITRGIQQDRIVIMTPPPVNEEPFHEMCRKSGSPIAKFLKNVPPYADVIRDLAETYQINLVDIYEAMMATKDWKTFFSDGLHFSTSGASFVTSQLSPLIEKRLEGWPMHMPDWKDIDHQNVTSMTFCNAKGNQ